MMNDFENHVVKELRKLSADLAAVKGVVEQDHKSLFGNGQPGLLDRMTRLETQRKTHFSVAAALWNFLAAIAGIAAGLLGAYLTRV